MYAARAVAAGYDADNSGMLVRTSGWTRDPEFVCLSPEVGRLWQELEGGRDLNSALREVARAYRVPVERVRADMAPWVEELARRSMLVGTSRRARRRRPDRGGDHNVTRIVATRAAGAGVREQGASVAGFALAVLVLRCAPIGMRLAIMRASVRLRHQIPTLETTEELVVRARRLAARFWGNADCLEISVAALFAGALLGRAPAWRFGTTFRPPHRHAWVQVGSTAVDDAPQMPGREYKPVLRV